MTFHRAEAFADDFSLWTAAVREAPSSAYAHSQLGAELMEKGERRRAVAELESAADLARDPADRHRLRAMALIYSGRPEEAVKEARAAIRTGGNPDLRRDAAVVLLQAGETSEAIPVLQALASAAPGASDYTYWLAAAMSRAGRIGEAVDLLVAWCRDRPGHPRMEETLAVLLARLGRVGEAREHAAALLGVPPGDPRAAALLDEWIRSGRLR
jgi:Flp pilus assembly protein TadD